MRFSVPLQWMEPSRLALAYLAGWDCIPWPGRVSWEQGILEITRSADQSAALTLPWPIADRGTLALSTGTLIERERPYALPLELARGKVGRLLNHLNDWKALGFQSPASAEETAGEAAALFAQAVVLRSDSERSQKLAQTALELAVQAGETALDAFVDQTLVAMRMRQPKRHIWCGVEQGRTILSAEERQLLDEFSNAAMLRVTWRDCESEEGQFTFDLLDRLLFFCREERRPRSVGPLISLLPGELPGWLPLDAPAEEVQRRASRFLTAILRNYRGKVDLWEAIGPLHPSHPFAWSDESLANFTARIVQHIRNLSPGVPIAVSVRQPWLEELRQRESEFPAPIVLDALIRAGVGLSQIVLDTHLGYDRGTLLRDGIDVYRQLEFWGQLGLPLIVRFCAPSRCDADPLAVGNARIQAVPWSDAVQAEWTRIWLRILLTKSFVRGFFWSQLRDAEPHEFPHGGLWDIARRPKPVVKTLTEFRRRYLN
ncbi:MAG: hypothetical protein ACUVTW_08165 [Thermogutta sp.]